MSGTAAQTSPSNARSAGGARAAAWVSSGPGWRLLPIALMLLVGLSGATPALAQSSGCTGGGSSSGAIVLDGQFGDWGGMPCIPDPPGDCRQSDRDLSGVWFGTNPDDATAYFMLERYGGDPSPVGFRIRIDTNNNGVYNEPGDRVLAIRYQPRQSSSRVDVELWDGTGAVLAQIVSDADLGESRDEGARRVEAGVPFSLLGITAGQAIRFTVTSHTGNTNGNTCDTAPEVQWSPANALGVALLVLVVVGAAALLARRRGGLGQP